MTGLDSAAVTLSTVFGLGRLTAAPGTVGSVAACLVALLFPSAGWLALGLVVLVPLGLWASDRGARALGVSDPGMIVIDEVAGQWVALLGHLSGGAWVLPGLLLFRLFDILKPWPVNRFEKLPGGLGIMADDLVGGLLANLLLAALRYLFLAQPMTGILSWF